MQENIALISDVHANLEALKAVLMDIKNHNIKTIYSLGDVIGLGNHPSECLELILENNIINILGNAEEYVIFGADSFDYLKKHNIARYYNAVWTREALTTEQIRSLKRMPHSIDVEIGNQKIALCHFPIDVRYDYAGVWKYNGEDVSSYFEINTPRDMRFSTNQTPLLISANNDPLFGGKKVDEYNSIIYGHYHFFRKHTKDNIDFYSLNGTVVAIDKQAMYYVLENVNNGIILTENMVDYDYEKLHYELDNTDYPNKETFEKYIKKL